MAERMPVGQVWIRVSPDTRGFADETKDRLKKMKSLDKYKVPIEIEVDTEKVEKDFANAVGNLQRKAATENYRVKIQTELEWRRGEARKQLREVVEKYQSLADDKRVDIKTSLDSDGATTPVSPTVELNLDERAFERDVKRLMEQTKAEVKVAVDKTSLRDEVRESVREVGDFIGQMMRDKKNRIQIEVETSKLQEAELWLAEMQKNYNTAADAEQSARRELERTSREYNRVRRKIGQIQVAMDRVNQETDEGAEEYGKLAEQMGNLSEQLRVYGNERKRLMDFGRTNYLEIETNMESMREAESRVEELRERVNEIGSEITVGLDRSSVAAVSAELFALVRPRIINIHTRLQNHAQWQKFWGQASSSAEAISGSLMRYGTQIVGLRLLWRSLVDIVQIIPKLDMMIPLLAAASTAAVAVISAASTLLGSVLTIGADMLRIFNLALTLPSILAGLAGTVLIIGRAVVDFKEEFPQIISYWKQLGETVSDRVWEKARDNVDALHKALVPVLDAHVPDWAEAWGDSMGAFADGLRSAVREGHLEEFLENSIKGTEAAEKGWEALGSALLRMVGIGSRFFPDLGDWFSDTMVDFEDWVKDNDENGSFERWIEDGIKAMKDLGRVIGATGSILRSLALAGRRAGLPTLTDFADGMSGFAERMKRPGAMDGFIAPLERMVLFMKDLKTLAPEAGEAAGKAWDLLGYAAMELSGPITGALEGILTAFSSTEFQEDIKSFTRDLGTFIEDITPGLESLVTEFGSMAAIVGTAMKAWGPAFNEMLLLFEDLGQGMRPGIQSFLEETGPELERLVRDLRPEVEELGDAIGDLLGNPDFQEFVKYMIDSLGDILSLAVRVGTWLLRAFSGFASWWADQPRWFKDISADLMVLVLALPAIGIGLMTLKKFFRPVIVVFNALRWAAVALSGALGRVGAALLAWGARGGLGGIIARVLGRSLLLGGGPVGWAALIVSLVPANLPFIIADAIMHALGFDGTAAGRLVEEIKRQIDEEFGDLSLFGIMWEGLKAIFARDSSLGDRLWGLVQFLLPGIPLGKAIAKGFVNWARESLRVPDGETLLSALKVQIKNALLTLWRTLVNAFSDEWAILRARLEMWNPLGDAWAAAPKFFYEKVIKPILDWIFGTGDEEDDTNALAHETGGAGSPWATNLWNSITEAVQAGIDWVKRKIENWDPTSRSGKFLKDLLERIPGLLGLDENGEFSWDTFFSSWSNYGSVLWNDHIKPWLKDGWDYLVGEFKKWEPVAAIIDFIDDPVGTVLEWLGMGANWLGKKGLGASAGGVSWGMRVWNDHLKPWLDDGWTDLDTQFGLWDPSGGSDAPEGSIDLGGIIEKVKRDFFGDDPAGGITTAFGGAFDEIIPAAKAETARRIAELKQSIRAEHMTPSDGSGLIGHLLGLDKTSVGNVRANAALTGQSVGSMSTSVTGSFNTMGREAGDSVTTLSSTTDTEFRNVGSLTSRRSSEMRNGVVKQFDSMASDSGREMRGLRSETSSTLSQTKNTAIARGREMNRAYTAQMVSMMVRSISTAKSLSRGVVRALQVNAYGAGRSTGSTYASGLGSGLRAARSVAYGMRYSIRGALSFSAYGSGRTVGGTFASGIRSRYYAVRNAAYALAAAARRALPRSPAAEGPFSGSGWGGWGEAIGDELAKGLKSAAPEVAAEAQSLMSGVHDALDAKAEVGFGVSTNALNDAFAGAEIQAAEMRENQLTRADLANGVAEGLGRVIEPAGKRDLVALVRRTDKNGAR